MNWIEIGERIKSKRKELGFTLKEFGARIGRYKQTGKGVSHVTVRNWESGAEIKADNVEAILKALSVEREWLLSGKTTNDIKENANISLPLKNGVDQVPLISMVQAGDFSEVVDSYPVGTGVESVPCPYTHSDNTFAVQVKGYSMAPEFPEGMIIYIDPNQLPENKQFCIAKLPNSNEATFKQYVIEDGQAYLRACNPSWPNQYIPINEECHIVGRMIGIYKNY